MKLYRLNTTGLSPFSVNEDVSVQFFLTAPALADNFHLPLSPEALQEVRLLQQDCQNLTIQQQHKDKWVYPWGQKYTSSKFYHSLFF